MHYGFLSFFVPFPSFFFQTKKLNTKQQKCIRKAWNLRQSMLWNMYSHTNLKGCFKGYHKFHIPNCVYFVSGNLCLPLALMRVFNTPRNSLSLSHTHTKQCSPLYSKLVRLSVYFAYSVPLQYDVYAWEYIYLNLLYFSLHLLLPVEFFMIFIYGNRFSIRQRENGQPRKFNNVLRICFSFLLVLTFPPLLVFVKILMGYVVVIVTYFMAFAENKCNWKCLKRFGGREYMFLFAEKSG